MVEGDIVVKGNMAQVEVQGYYVVKGNPYRSCYLLQSMKNAS